MPKGWLVDLINRFGHHGGFKQLLERFTKATATPSADAKDNGLNVALIFALVRPFGQCYELLTSNTVSTYLLPIVEAQCFVFWISKANQSSFHLLLFSLGTIQILRNQDGVGQMIRL